MLTPPRGDALRPALPATPASAALDLVALTEHRSAGDCDRGERISSMDNRIPVVVRMQVKCAMCGHTENETYEFDMPFAKSQGGQHW
jgi:hypothetical protein